MVEPPAAASPGVAVLDQDALLATKLHMPAPQPGLVPRPRLTERLNEGLARGLVLVCGPAGYGKTVLLADWARHSQLPAAWLSLDAGDNDPARFWRHAVAALDRARPGIGERVAPLLGPPAPSSFQGLVTALINELAAQPDEALLVLDDYHVIGAQPVHESLAFLLEHRPAGVHLVLASRSDPPLALARLRARGQLAELRAAELRFTSGEAATLLRHVAARSGLALPDAVAAALAARTEGWAAGLQLAGLSLRGQDDVTGFVAAFTGSHRYVLDYLAEEVLERQDEQVRIFLLETSVLDRLSGPLCDAVTGREGSQALLEEAERAGLFLIPLDEVRGWWRYHHLFADLLRARLQEEQPGRVPDLHRNAAAWYEHHGLADDAIGHAAAAGEMLWAARIIEQHFDMVYDRGEAATIHRWLSVLPAEVVRSRPRLLLAQALMAATSGHLEVVEPLLDAVDCAPPDWADEPFEPTAGVAASHLINVPALTTLHRGYLAQFRGDAEATAAFATQTLAEIKPGERLPSAVAHGFLAVAEWLRGRLHRGRTRLRGQRHRLARDRAAHHNRVGILLAGSAPARPGPPGRGRADLRAGPGSPGHVRPAAAGRRSELCGPGGDRLPAGRTRRRPATRHRGHRAVPPVRLYHPASQRPGHPGHDPAGHRRSGRRAAGDHRGRTGRTRPGGPAQPGSGPAGPAAAGPGRPGRRGPFPAGDRPRPGR